VTAASSGEGFAGAADCPVGNLLGHQILGLAPRQHLQADLCHRGLNEHPCWRSGLVEITSQNHGFRPSMPPPCQADQVEITHRNLKRRPPLAGLRHRSTTGF